MTKRAWLDRFCGMWPDAPSLALWRANEAAELSRVEFRAPCLDLGCGTGRFAAAAFPRSFDRGCDVDLRVVEAARRSGAYGGVDHADGARLPYEPGRFRTVIANCVLEHVHDIDAVLREIARVLEPGGRLHFSVPTPLFNDWFCLRRVFREAGCDGAAGRALQRLNEIQEHRNIFDRDAWGGMLGEAGLRLEAVREFLPRREYAWFSVIDTVWKAPMPGFGRVHGVHRLMSRVARGALGGVLARFWSAALRAVAGNGARPEDAGAGYFMTAEKPA
jgi:SAM-dependent methyltransferase